jgi:hypothetical protein
LSPIPIDTIHQADRVKIKEQVRDSEKIMLDLFDRIIPLRKKPLDALKKIHRTKNLFLKYM